MQVAPHDPQINAVTLDGGHLTEVDPSAAPMTPDKPLGPEQDRHAQGMAGPMATRCQAVLKGTQRGLNHAIAFVRYEPAQRRDERPDRDGDQATQDDTEVPRAASSMDVLR